MQERAADAEDCCKQLIQLITNDGSFLATHGFDYIQATQAILEDYA